MSSRGPRRPALRGPQRAVAAAFVALCLLPTCSSREAHDTAPTALKDVGSAKQGGDPRALDPVAPLVATWATAPDLAVRTARDSPRRALAQSPDAPAAESAADADAASVTASDLATLAGFMRDDVDDRVVTLRADIELNDGESLPPVEKTIEIRGACGSSGTDACVLDAKGLTRHVVVGAVGSLTMRNLVLRDGSAARHSPPSSDGGAVFVFGAFYASRVAFVNCAATADGTSAGGSVAVAGGDALFDECAFVDSTSADDGGALWVSIGGRAEIRRSSFENCSAGGLGGGVAGADSATLTIRYCVFDDFVTAREEASRDAYVGAKGALYLEPFAIYSDYYASDGTPLFDDADAEITGAELGPPEGFAYRAQGAGLVARAGFEPPPPGMGFAPPPPSAAGEAGDDGDGGDAAATEASLAVLGAGRGVDRGSIVLIAIGVAVAIALLWMLGRFLSKEHHTHRPSERTLKHMRAADDAMLEARRADDEAEALAAREETRQLRAARAAQKDRALNRGARVEDAVARTRTVSTMQVVVEDGDDVVDDVVDDVADDRERTATSDRASDRASFALAAASSRPPLAPLASDVDVRSNALDDDEGSSSQEGEDEREFANVENRAFEANDVSGERRGRAHFYTSRGGRNPGRRARSATRGFDRSDVVDDDVSRLEGVFDATSAEVRAKSDFVRASWAGAAAASAFPVSSSVPSDEDFFESRETRERANGSAQTHSRGLETNVSNVSNVSDVSNVSNVSNVSHTRDDVGVRTNAEIRSEPAVAARLASVASASAAARAALAMRRGAAGSGRGGATARAGSVDALRARVEAARRAARER